MVCPCPGRTYVERVNRPTPLRKPRAHRPGLHRHHVVIVGAGFGGLAAARALADAPVDVTIVDAHNHHTFQPLLYQVATAGLGGDVALLAGIALVSAALVFGGNLLANILYGVLDPRMRVSEGRA